MLNWLIGWDRFFVDWEMHCHDLWLSKFNGFSRPNIWFLIASLLSTSWSNLTQLSAHAPTATIELGGGGGGNLRWIFRHSRPVQLWRLRLWTQDIVHSNLTQLSACPHSHHRARWRWWWWWWSKMNLSTFKACPIMKASTLNSRYCSFKTSIMGLRKLVLPFSMLGLVDSLQIFPQVYISHGGSSLF